MFTKPGENLRPVKLRGLLSVLNNSSVLHGSVTSKERHRLLPQIETETRTAALRERDRKIQ